MNQNDKKQPPPTAQKIEGELDLEALQQIAGGAVPKPRPIVQNTTR